MNIKQHRELEIIRVIKKYIKPEIYFFGLLKCHIETIYENHNLPVIIFINEKNIISLFKL